jgi:hypothetical protein
MITILQKKNPSQNMQGIENYKKETYKRIGSSKAM